MRAKLTARRMETARSPATLTDEHGMQRRMSPGGATSWIQRDYIKGLRTHNAVGHYPETGLAAARHSSDGTLPGPEAVRAGTMGRQTRIAARGRAPGEGLRELDGEPGL